MTAANFQRAHLEIEGGQTIDCLFNPTSYTVTKTSSWSAQAVKGQTAPTPEYGGGAPAEIQLALLLDNSLDRSGRRVVEAADKLMDLMVVAQGGGAGSGGAQNTRRPPQVTFVWGRRISFKAFAKSLTIEYKLFSPDGEPLRADVKLGLIQADGDDTPRGQNPTTRAEGSLGTRQVLAGDSLESIAHDVYGDPNRWRVLAEANGIDDPLALRTGTALALPRLDR